MAGSTTPTQAEERQRSIAESVPGIVFEFVLRPDGSMAFSYVSSGSEKILGISPIKIQGDAQALFRRVHADDLSSLQTSVAASAQTLEAWQWEGRITGVDGVTHWFQGTSQPLLLDDGCVQWHGVLLDRTEIHASQTALAYSSEQLRYAFDDSALGMAITNTQGIYQRVNRAFCEFVGQPEFEILGSNLAAITHPDDVDAGRSVVLAALAGAERPGSFEKRFIRPDGSVVWADIALSVIAGPTGEPLLLGQGTDITARKQAEQRVERNTRMLVTTLAAQRAMTSDAHDRELVLQLMAVHALDAFTSADGAVVEMRNGEDSQCVSGAGTLAIQLGLSVPVAGSMAGHVMLTGSVARCDDIELDERANRVEARRLGIRSMCAAPLIVAGVAVGSLKVTSVRPNAFDEDDETQLELMAGALSAAMRHAEDVARNAALLNERTNALLALSDSERLFRLAFDNAPFGMLMVTLTEEDLGALAQANSAMSDIIGYSVDELSTMTYTHFQHPDNAVLSHALLDRIREGVVDTAAVERRWIHADGHIVWVSLRIAVVRGENTEPLYMVVQAEDVTERRAAQEQLQTQSQLLELIPTAVIVRAFDGTIQYWNRGAEMIYGWPSEAAIGAKTHTLLATGFTDGLNELNAALLADGEWSGDLTHVTAVGKVIVVSSQQVLQRNDDGSPGAILEINTDITAAREAEIAVSQSEERFRAQFNHSAAGQVVRGLDGTWLEVNDAFAKMLGKSQAELIGERVFDYLHPDDVARMKRNNAILFDGQVKALESEMRLRKTNGEWLDANTTVSLVRDTEGRPKHFVGVLTDITARKVAERARDVLTAELAQRNGELEEANQLKLDLIGMLGHEIGNPLTSIMGYSEMLMDGWASMSDDLRKKSVTAIDRGAQGINRIVSEVLALVSVDAGKLSALPETVVIKARLESAMTATDSVDALVECNAELTARVQGGHLDQILVNLLSNATKYGSGATRLRAWADGNKVFVAVDDSGNGVDPKFRVHLFDRFSRADATSSMVKGTGLGLYIVRELARANGGDVVYEPSASGGSSFIVSLPLSA